MMYIRPKQVVQVKLFLLNPTGEYVGWRTTDVYRSGAIKVVPGRKCATLSMLYHCREEAIGSIISNLHGLNLSDGHKVTLVPPSSSGVALSTLDVTVGGSLNGNRVYTSKNNPGTLIYKKGYALSTTKRSHRQVYNLMDVVLGTVSMLMSGPSAYIRPKVGLNECNVGVSKEVKYIRRSYSENRNTSKVKNYKTLVSESNLSYSGVTNFYMDHPASFSIITGLFKNCLQMWFDNLYDRIDRKIDIAATKAKLSSISRKKVLSKKDKEVLLNILDKLKPYLYGFRSEDNPGAYPLNKYTHSMFLKYIDQNNEKGVVAAWTQKTSQSVYPSYCYGFAQWCRNQDIQTPEYTNRENKDWGGLVGNTLSFSGHDR